MIVTVCMVVITQRAHLKQKVRKTSEKKHKHSTSWGVQVSITTNIKKERGSVSRPVVQLVAQPAAFALLKFIQTGSTVKDVYSK